jgi:hypothetical protein
MTLDLSETVDSMLPVLGHYIFGWMIATFTVRRKTRRKRKRRTQSTLTVWRKARMKRKRSPSSTSVRR